MNKYARRSDKNQEEIVSSLRDMGLPVKVISHCPGGCLDLIVGCRGILYWIEVKSNEKASLTKAEHETFELFHGYPVLKIWSLDQLLELLGLIDDLAS